MILINKIGFSEIKCNKNRNIIKAGFYPTQLTAQFYNMINIQSSKITPVWIIECNNIEYFDIKESIDNKTLSISTSNDNLTGEVIKITLVDQEQNYVCDSIELEVISL